MRYGFKGLTLYYHCLFSQMEKVTSRSVELNVDHDAAYDIGIISANAFGHSPLVFLDVPSLSAGEIPLLLSYCIVIL